MLSLDFPTFPVQYVKFICYCKTKQYCNATSKVGVVLLRVGKKQLYEKARVHHQYLKF